MKAAGASEPRLCAISVDLDEIGHYHAIHGLGAGASVPAPNTVYERALERFAELAGEERVPLTLFAIGSSLAAPENGRRLREWVERGHEVGNHSYDHFYDLSRRPRAEIKEQIERASGAIADATGKLPVGFRAPGYVMSQRVYDVLSECSLAYSSSVFPCPYYYAAKLGVMTAMRLFGKRSQSVIDAPSVLRSPRVPYRVGRPYWRVGNGLLELPIQVTPRARLPFIGTSLCLAGPALARRMTRSLAGATLVNLELHGVDLLDAEDGLEALAAHQVDLRVPVPRKLATLRAVIEELRALGYEFVRLEAAARRLRASAKSTPLA